MNKKLLVRTAFVSLGLLLLGCLLGILFGILSVYLTTQTNHLRSTADLLRVSAITIPILVIVQFVITFTVLHLLSIAKNWGSIQDSQSTVSVGKAIGFLFIPFFNYYWIFKVWGGFPKEYNAFIDRNNLAAPKIESNTFVILPIAIIVSALISPLILLIGLFLFPVLPFALLPSIFTPFIVAAVLSESCDAVNNISAAKNLQTNFVAPKKRILNPIITVGLLVSLAIPAVLSVAVIVGIGFLFYAAQTNYSQSGNRKDSQSNKNSSTVSNNKQQTFPDPNPEKKADFQMNANDFYKDALAIEKWDSGLAKYRGKVVEISGRVYLMGQKFDGKILFFKTEETTVDLELGAAQADRLQQIKDNERVRAKCDVPASSIGRVKLTDCIILERKPAVMLDEKPDISVTAKEYYEQVVDYNLDYEVRTKNRKKYFGKVIDITGEVDEISGKKNYLTLGRTNFVSCNTDEDSMKQFGNLKDGQQATFRATDDGISLCNCIVVR